MSSWYRLDTWKQRPPRTAIDHPEQSHARPGTDSNHAIGRPAHLRRPHPHVGAWRAYPETPVATVEPKKTDDGTTVQRKTYGPGKAGAEVVLFVINGGGHTWPGRDPRVRFLGKSTQNISANDLMWEFFQRHPMKP